MTKVYVESKEQIKELYYDSSLTLEGLEEESCEEYLDWVKGFTPMKVDRVFITKGKVMNDIFKLTGTNQYQDDLNIVSIKLADMEDMYWAMTARFMIGARWFDDIVDNNQRRERGYNK